MDLLKAQLDRIQQQLSGLSASQKMLTASLVAIMVMTLLWWGRYAGQAEMVPLLDQSFAQDDIGRIKGQLRSAGIAVKVEGDRVLVPADKQGDAIASLAYAEVLPDNMVDGFEEMSQRMTPWDAGPRTEALMKRAKEITLRQVIGRFPGVKDAIVLIEPGAGRRIGGVNQASASLAIEMDDRGKGDRKIADAAANLVSGAQLGLKPGNVKVAIGGKQYQLDDKSGLSIAASDELRAMTAETELYLEDKLQGLWPYIDEVFVKVSVDIENKTSQLQSKKFDKDHSLSREKSIDTRNEESVMPGGGGAEPGIMPNTGMSIAEPKPLVADATKTSEESNTVMENFVAESIETVSTPAGKVTVVGASVRVPRTHFVEAFKKRFAVSTAQPDATALNVYIDAELAQMTKEVRGVMHVKDESDTITVALYDDVLPMMAATTTVPVGSTVATTVSGHAKEIAIGALAVISLFMVSTMVRKGAPAPIVAASAEHKVAPHLSTGHELAGEAGEGDSMLDGMELDEDAVRAQQMLEQVSTMVEENPDAAANIMKRWLNRS
jgi:flagellar biosynthesis/type III secretory pathway M-ring protein FliF/YscJ